MDVTHYIQKGHAHSWRPMTWGEYIQRLAPEIQLECYGLDVAEDRIPLALPVTQAWKDDPLGQGLFGYCICHACGLENQEDMRRVA